MGVANKTGRWIIALSLVVSGTAMAKVSAEEAARLGKDLTPTGGIKAANKDGSITAWEGGLDKSSEPYKDGDRVVNPWPNDKPLFTITAANMDQYKDKLSLGQQEMLTRYDTYKIPVYQTRRSYASPKFFYEATKKNALEAYLENDGESMKGAVTGVPFPIPKSGKEVIWNHKTRYRGRSLTRYNNQAAVQQSGAFTIYKLKEDARFTYNFPNQKPEDLNNIITYFMQKTLAPTRQAGGILLVHETMDQIAEARRAWLYNSGQRRLRRAPNVAYDNPGTGADGLRTNDQLDFFNGATDRYEWKLVGKREMYIPYNSYELHSDKYKYEDVVKQGHLNQDLTRYELHRVWEVDATLKDGTSHIYKRRTFYVDEDSWSMALADIYDKRDQLWRVQEGHWANAYFEPMVMPVCGTVYDLQANRYLAMDMANEDPEVTREDFDAEYFNPSNVKKLAGR